MKVFVVSLSSRKSVDCWLTVFSTPPFLCIRRPCYMLISVACFILSGSTFFSLIISYKPGFGFHITRVFTSFSYTKNLLSFNRTASYLGNTTSFPLLHVLPMYNRFCAAHSWAHCPPGQFRWWKRFPCLHIRCFLNLLPPVQCPCLETYGVWSYFRPFLWVKNHKRCSAA